MSNTIKLKKGLDIPISGAAAQVVKKVVAPGMVAVKPSDFKGLVPRLLVREGDAVLAGSPVLSDKQSPDILFTSPVSGTVAQVVRGDKRKLLAVLIKADSRTSYVDFGVKDIDAMDADQIKELLFKSGLWAAFIQRPYGITAKADVTPKAVFVSAFNTAPLAADVDFTLKGEMEFVQAGVDVLNKLTEGGVHVSMQCANSPFAALKGIVPHFFEGRHPAGNVGIQIHNISPILKGESVWTVTPFLLAAIGKLFKTGRYDVSRKIAVTGPAAFNPCYVQAVPGLAMKDIREFFGSAVGSVRVISGDCLSGEAVGADGYLGFYDNQITVLCEGDDYEAFGWAKPFRFNQYSTSHTYFHWILEAFCPKKKYDMDTNLHGGERAFVVSDVYGKVLPMNLFPVYLTKACLAQDIEKMEKYGIYEVLPEDFALCEYVCPSKINIQSIISDGIDLMLKEMA